MDLLVEKDFLKFYNQDLFAKTAASTLYNAVYEKKEGAADSLFEMKQQLERQYDGLPAVNNAMKYFFHKLPMRDIPKDAKERNAEVIKQINLISDSLAAVAKKKIKPGAGVFVHSFNNHIYSILREASKYNNFSIISLEHSSFQYGEKLKQKFDNVSVFPDLAIDDALNHTDLVLIGVDGFSEHGAVVKKGTSTLLKLAQDKNIPVYFCTTTWNYSPLALKRLQETVEEKPVFEFISSKDIDKYISEHGIFKPEHLMNEARFYNSWMFV